MRKVVIEGLDEVSRRDVIKKLGPVAAAVGLAGCTGGDDGEDGETTNFNETPRGEGTPEEPNEVSPGGTLHAGMQPGILTFDGRSVNGLQSMQVMFSIYTKLTRWRRVDNQLVNESDLADEWGWESETELVYELNPDAKFHNGEPVTASDVAYTFATMQDDPEFTTSLLFPDVTVEAIDERTVSFDTGEHTSAPLESTVGFIGCIVNETADQEGDMANEPVGSGPFEFAEWVEDDHVYLEAFDDYWKEDDDGNQLPYLDRIEFIIYPDVQTKLTNLRQGGLDWIDLVPRRNVQDVIEDESLVTSSTGPGGFMSILQFNTTQEPFSDKTSEKRSFTPSTGKR